MSDATTVTADANARLPDYQTGLVESGTSVYQKTAETADCFGGVVLALSEVKARIAAAVSSGYILGASATGVDYKETSRSTSLVESGVYQKRGGQIYQTLPTFPVSRRAAP